MSSAPSPDEIVRDATWLAQALDPSAGSVRLVAMDRASYRAASFLDDRLLQQPVDAQIVAWPAVEAAVACELRTDARWIFHIGHVGSTLVSRLLGEIGGVLGVREPRILRDLAMSPPAVRAGYVGPIAKLMSRTFAADEIACVKATSFASEIAVELIPPNERALFLYARPGNYVASILAGENSLKELHALGDYRRQRLQTRGLSLPQPQNDAERAAIAWVCEMTSLEAAAEQMGDRRIAWADFDVMLEDMPAALATVADHLGLDSDPARMRTIVAGPLMQRYSKALEYEYSPALRNELIAQEVRYQEGRIEAAVAMLNAHAQHSLLLARALDRSRES